MAQCKELLPFILSWEGGYVNDPDDLGGATNKGVTIATWRQVGYDKTGDGVIDVDDLRQLTDEDVMTRVLKPHYWDRWRADQIEDQAIANICVDWCWCSGRHAITRVQKLLGVKPDGIVGQITLAAINSASPLPLFMKIKQDRRFFLEGICRSRSKNRKFLKGWLRRLDAITYQKLLPNE